MFPLHYATRRALCRLGFLTLCLAPVLAAVTWGAVRRWPGAGERFLMPFAADLGVDVAAGRLIHARPGVSRLESVDVLDRESDTLLARAAAIEVHDRGGAVTLLITGLELHCLALDRWARIAERWLPDVDGLARMELRAPDARFVVEGSSGEPLSLTLITDESAAGPVLQLEFVAQGEDASAAAPETTKRQRVRLTLGRDRRGAAPTTVYELQTGERSLPCAAAASLSPLFGELGREASFRGRVQYRPGSAGGTLALSGEFTGVELERVVTARFPQRITGAAAIEFDELRMSDGRVSVARGTIQAGPGQIGAHMLAAARERLAAATTPGRREMVDSVEYDRLALEFALDARGLSLTELEGEAAALRGRSALISVGHVALLGAPREEKLPATVLVELLAPEGEPRVPATATAESLLRWLPLATRGTREPGEARRPNRRTGTRVPR